ncbi:MAG: NUDIX domain-containing protein, partial [Chloroflexota bacterium]
MGYIEDMRALVGHRLLMISVGVVLIFDQQGRLLLGRRADDGEWGAVGGIMEPGETIEETARRETREEVGLDLGELAFLGVGSGPEYAHTYP